MSHRIAAVITQIRNGCAVGRPFVDLPLSNVARDICKVLVGEGFAWDSALCEGDTSRFRLFLKYGSLGQSVIGHIGCVSKSGRRVYSGVSSMDCRSHGFGVLIVSTSRGIVSQFEARRLGVGGEVLVEVW